MLARQTVTIRTLPWSPDGQRIASSGFSPSIHVWDAVTGEQIGAHRGHRSLVTAVGWSPDGSALASGGRDGYLRMWELASLPGMRR